MSNAKVKVQAFDLTEMVEKLRAAKEERGSRSSGRSMKDAFEMLGDDIPSEVKDALVEVIAGMSSKDGTGGSKMGTVIEAQAELLKYMSQMMPREGAFVERNEFGDMRYNFPDTENNEAGVVVEVWPTYRGEDGSMCNGVIAFCDRKSIVRLHPVDLRFYKEVEASKVKGAH